MRFYRTADFPPGFYRDEAAVSAHVLCLAQSGRTLDGARWPLMAPVLGGGYSTIAWQAPAAAWTRVAGGSIGALRAFAALCGVMTIGGVFCFALFAAGSTRVAGFAALSAAVSPWAFQFSRIAWDPAIAPVYLAWALALLCFSIAPRATASRIIGWIALLASAGLFAAACISYPPLRAQVPFVLAAFLVWKFEYARAHAGRVIAFTATLLVCTGPLLLLTGSGAIQGRFDALSVFNSAYWAQQGVTSPATVALHGSWLLAKNLLAHFTPSYLLVSGDASLRHSTQAFGIWSWLDALALVGAAIVLLRRRERLTGWVAFVAAGYLAGVLPAALTREGIPHALRSIGALPFLAVLVGTAIEALGRGLPRLRSLAPIAASGVALVFAAVFWRTFFVSYPAAAGAAFDASFVERLRTPDSLRVFVSGEGRSYPAQALRYYELRAGFVRCISPSH